MRTTRTGGVEALELEGKRFTVGVLWHPEAGEDARLFEALVEEARRYRAKPGAAPTSVVQ